MSKFYRKGLLDPKRLGRDVLGNMRKELGSLMYSAQVGQQPTPREGNMFKRSWFRVIDAEPPYEQVVRGWDLASTSEVEAMINRTEPAYTAGVKMGRYRGRYYVIHAERRRAGPFDVRQMIKNLASQDGINTVVDIPQDPGQAGKDQAQSIVRSMPGYNIRYSPEPGDKILKLEPMSAQAEAGNILVVRGDWNEEWFDEICAVPNNQFKDQVDATHRAWLRLTQGFLKRASAA
jgi:predicted phage terminase large subunit-like protein